MNNFFKSFLSKSKNNDEDNKLENLLVALSLYGFQSIDETNKKDVFIIGYPKSGTTLLQHIIAHLVFGLKKNTSKNLINSVVTEYYKNPYFFRLNERHFFKSHELPNKKIKNVIYIVRDGRDAILSYYYMLKNMNKDVSLEKLYNSGGDSFVGNWNQHVLAWKKNQFKANILYIKYEELIENKSYHIKQIAQFLNISCSPDEISQIVEASSLDNMKSMEKSYSWERIKKIQNWKKNTSFVRKGKLKGYLNEDNIKSEWIEEFTKRSYDGLNFFNYI